HARADEGKMPEHVQREDVEQAQRAVHTVIATPAQATTMPTSISGVGTTPNIASSSTTANTGGRYIMLVTRVASPCRSSQYSAITAKMEAKMTSAAIEANRRQSHVTLKPSTASASGASTASEAANCTTVAAF